MSKQVSLFVNGKPATAEAAPEKTLARYLRDDLRLTGAKIGCNPGDGDCGACTVLVEGRAQRACLVEMGGLSGRKVETIEGLARNGKLHPLQEAFVRAGAIQCGFCTPGFIMAAKGLLDRNPRPKTEEIKEALSGVLCRCTGYVKVVQAVEDAAAFLAEGKWPPVRLQVETGDGGAVGVAVYPKDGFPKVTGEARFADDLYFERMLYCKLLFSEHPHAEILSIDTAEAERSPGVAAVLTAKDVPGTNRVGVKVKDKDVFAADRVRCRADVVAAVYAETEESAREALGKIRVSYRPLPAVFDAREALKEGAPLVHPENKTGNVLAKVEIKRGDIEKGFAEAAVVVENEYTIPWVDHAFLEPEAAVGYVDERGVATLWIPSQCPFRDRDQLAAILDLPPEKIRVIVPAIGGAFGGKEDITLHPYVMLGVLRTGRPVKLTATRAESFLIHHKKHAMRLHYKTGTTREGRLTALQVRVIANGGAYAYAGPMIIQQCCIFATGPYYIPHVDIEGVRVYTNTVSCGAFRGFGINQATFAMENQMDILARELGLDPIELRLQNALDVGSPISTGQVLKASVGYKECLRKLQGALSAHRPKAGGKKRLGVGIAGAFKNCGIGQGRPDKAGAVVELTPEGRLRVRIGAADVGEGCTTVAAQIAAETLGVPYDEVSVMTPDTDQTPDGGQTSASRQTLITGNATVKAARDFKEKLLGFVAKEFEIAPEDLLWKDGRAFYSRGGQLIATNRAVAERAAAQGVSLQGDQEYLCPRTFSVLEDASGVDPDDYRNYVTFSFVANGAIVEVDETSGEVKVQKVIAAADCGRVIYPQGLEGQIEGCVAMGLGYALSEQYRVDNGHPATHSLTQVGIPTLKQMPEIEQMVVQDPEPNGPFGAKGFAEAGLLPTAPAIINAIYDAVGVRVKDLPATPQKVLGLIRAAKG